MELITNNLKDIVALCEKHGVASLSVFGSMARGEASEASDVDLLVKFGNADIE